MSQTKRFWVAVASHDHVKRGVEEGIAQACHGKKGLLQRVHSGDGIVYYSPKKHMDDKVSTCKQFTALGKITCDSPYQVEDCNSGFNPYRIDVDYKHDIRPVPWDAVKHRIRFHARLRFGFLEISEEEFTVISDMMHRKVECEQPQRT